MGTLGGPVLYNNVNFDEKFVFGEIKVLML